MPDLFVSAPIDSERHVSAIAWIGEHWKYVATQHRTDQVYDLANDPLEMNNLVDAPAHADAQTAALGSFEA